MKKILLVVMLLASVLFLNACGNDKNPTISNPEEDYLTVKEGSYTYTVNNKRVYDVLKEQVGYSMLNDLIDTDLLKNTKSEGVSFWDQVTQEEINTRLDEDIFPNGNEDLTNEEKAEKRQKHLDKLFSDYGLITEQDVFNYYHLLLAREAYAESELNKQLAEKDFTDTEYQNYFNNNYKDEYYAIVVSFDSLRMFEKSLKQLGYQLKNDQIVFPEGNALDNKQIVKMFIELYNMVNSSKFNGTLALNEGVEYTYNLAEGKYNFDLEKIDLLHYTNREITIYESSIQKMLAEFDNYGSGDNFYTKKPQVYKSGSRYSLFMKIGQISHKLEDVKAEIREDLIDQKITNAFVNNEMLKLRIANNIVIYDSLFKDLFEEQIGALDVEYEIKGKDKALVAKTDLKDYSADELFSKMNRNYGISSAISELEYNRFLGNLDINKVYNFETKEAINATRWSIIQQSIKDEKANFKNDLYKENGYPASYGWEKFIKDIYGADNEYELERYFVFQDVKGSYAKSFGDLTNETATGDKWNFYSAQMQKMVEEYFNVTGVHLLITMNDESGNPVDPKDWTTSQVELAKDFYGQVMDYLNDETITDSATKKLQNVQNAYNRAPYFVAGVAAENQPVVEGVNYTFNGIEVSKFKSAGLVALFQDLGTFTNGQMVKEFNDAAKSIWDANNDSEAVVIYDSTPDNEGNYEYLVTQFGYHVYVNTKTTPIAEYATGKILPTIEDAQEYLKDSGSSKISSKLKTAIETYFKPVYTELTSTNKLQITSYKALKGLDITLHHDDYKVEDMIKFLELTIAAKEETLKYK